MNSHSEDVDAFVEQLNGVLIDTRDLFILDRRVAAGEVTPDEAKRMLISADRLFKLEEQEDQQGAEGCASEPTVQSSTDSEADADNDVDADVVVVHDQ
jgi:hypothetical protein